MAYKNRFFKILKNSQKFNIWVHECFIRLLSLFNNDVCG